MNKLRMSRLIMLKAIPLESVIVRSNEHGEFEVNGANIATASLLSSKVEHPFIESTVGRSISPTSSKRVAIEFIRT